MRNIKKLLIMTILAASFTGVASAYTLTVTNATNEDVAIDAGGFGVVGSSLMQGKIKDITGKKIHDIKTIGNTTYYKNAGAIPNSEFPGGKDKPLLKPGHTAVLEFTDIDLGMCFDWGNTKIGSASNNYSMVPQKIKFTSSEEMDKLHNAVSGMGSSIKEIGTGVGQLEGSNTKGAGDIIKGAGSLWEKTTDVATTNGCGNRSMFIVKDFDTGQIGAFIVKG